MAVCFRKMSSGMMSYIISRLFVEIEVLTGLKVSMARRLIFEKNSISFFVFIVCAHTRAAYANFVLMMPVKSQLV